jgi:hypothetical protein
MSEVSTVLDEVADRSETRLSEIRSVLADLKFCLHDYVHNLESGEGGAVRHDREALEWMQDALEDISATLTGIHTGARYGVSNQVTATAANSSDTGIPLRGRRQNCWTK